MQHRKLDSIDLLAIGNTVQLVGAVYQGKDEQYIVLLPKETLREQPTLTDIVDMNEADWVEFLKQNDNANTQVMIGNVKAIVKKCQRIIDQNISWEVYRRDGFKCRYCLADDVPLTVDHVDLWELGGATVKENQFPTA